MADEKLNRLLIHVSSEVSVREGGVFCRAGVWVGIVRIVMTKEGRAFACPF